MAKLRALFPTLPCHSEKRMFNKKLYLFTLVSVLLFSLTVFTQTQLLKNDGMKPASQINTGIPRILHQIWNNESIPAMFTDNIRGLVSHNRPPKWTYYFWTIATGTKLIQKEFPKLLQRYLKADGLIKADILRLVVLQHYGGVYLDLDTVSVKPLDAFVDTHNCSFVLEPDEHVFHPQRPTKMLMISNSAMFCKPGNWFIREVIEKLYNQPSSCKDAVKCTGPEFISKHYESLQRTNKSGQLPPIVDSRLFQDTVDGWQHDRLKRTCKEPFTNIKYEWVRDVCRYWIKRGREKRNVSEIAYTYHTWFHTNLNPKRLKTAKSKLIHELVQNITFY